MKRSEPFAGLLTLGSYEAPPPLIPTCHHCHRDLKPYCKTIASEKHIFVQCADCGLVTPFRLAA